MNRPCQRRWLSTEIAAAALLMTAVTAPAEADDFYSGKTVEILVGSAAGGGFDIYARALARHWGRFIPGNPTIVVRNMPGAGGARSAVYVSSVAPKDGTVLAAPMPGAIVGPLLEDNPQGGFDPAKLQYLGTADSGVRVCVTMDKSKVKTFEDALTTKAIMGATQPGGSSTDYAYLHRHTSGAKFDVVLGYQAMTDTSLAMERGELDGTCGWDWSSLKSMKADWIRDKRVNILFQVGLDPDPELSAMGVPEIWKFVKSEKDRKVVELVASQQVFMRFFVAPPATPPARIGELRTAFDLVTKDPDFLRDAERQQLSIKPLSGDKVQNLVQRMYATPKEIVERAKRAIKP
jgi:tripartite-type tricarboxylate transporter receptor subunit TctC